MKLTTALAASLLSAGVLSADTLELRSGQVVEGNYQGGTAQTIRFQAGGDTKVFQRNEVVALTLSNGANAAVPTGSGSSAGVGGESVAGTGADANQGAATIRIPQGTAVQVRMVDSIDSSKDQTGKRFTGTLESNLSANGKTLAPAGTTVHGQVTEANQAGRLAGKSVLSLTLTDVIIHGEAKALSTTPVTLSGQAEGRQTARRGAAGAIIGGIADGGEGAAKGAAIGAGTAGIRKGQAVVIPAGTLLEFNLSVPLDVRAQ